MFDMGGNFKTLVNVGFKELAKLVEVCFFQFLKSSFK
jgi:hypothetical protein